jgi:hypothetical protein
MRPLEALLHLLMVRTVFRTVLDSRFVSKKLLLVAVSAALVSAAFAQDKRAFVASSRAVRAAIPAQPMIAPAVSFVPSHKEVPNPCPAVVLNPELPKGPVVVCAQQPRSAVGITSTKKLVPQK